MWFNLTDYTLLEHIIFATGCLLWFVVYVIAIKNIHQHQFCEIPPITVGANVTWEFLKSFVFLTNMGLFYNIAYAGWFFLDLYITYGMFKYGNKLVSDTIKPYYSYFMAFNLLSWLIVQYLFMRMGYDDVVGAFSAFIINLVISSMYISIILTTKQPKMFSKTVAWAKMFGTGLVGVFAFVHWPNNYLLLSMGIIIFLMDSFYTYLLSQRQS